jgi:hypothetical protein
MVAAAVRYLSRLANTLGVTPGAVALGLRIAVAAAVLAPGIGATGCVVVQAHQRGHLAKRAMTSDRDNGEARFAEHERGSREGAEGGTGQPGGGCGCN